MTKLLALAAALLLILPGTGCSKLMPGKVEYGQQEVEAVPTLSTKEAEHQKQAAEFLEQKTQETKDAALATDADTSVVVPAAEAALVAKSLSGSLGEPLKPVKTNTPARKVAETLDKDSAKLDRKLDEYREETAPLVGKKIEGTGFLQLGYFTNLGLFLLIPLVIWAGLKIYGLFNPLVGAGLGVAERVGAKVAAKAVTSTIAGGERFKDLLASTDLDDKIKARIKEMYRTSQQIEQDKDVQELIRRLTA